MASTFMIWMTVILLYIMTSQSDMFLNYVKGRFFWNFNIIHFDCRVAVLGVETYFGDWIPLWVVFAFTAGCSKLDPLALVPPDGVPLDGAILSAIISDLERAGESNGTLLTCIQNPHSTKESVGGVIVCQKGCFFEKIGNFNTLLILA